MTKVLHWAILILIIPAFFLLLPSLGHAGEICGKVEDKAWAFSRWKMTLYAEGLNLTNHDNRRILNTTFNFSTGQPVPMVERGLPITPTAGLVFEF
jgi:hypothetical protein